MTRLINKSVKKSKVLLGVGNKVIVKVEGKTLEYVVISQACVRIEEKENFSVETVQYKLSNPERELEIEMKEHYKNGTPLYSSYSFF